MKTTQPPITNDQELAGYQAGADRLRAMIDRHEQDLATERQQMPLDMERVDQIRYQLRHLYGYYRSIQDAIDLFAAPSDCLTCLRLRSKRRLLRMITARLGDGLQHVA
jgi:hypothetical protein